MLNLSPVFQDAIDVLSAYSQHLQIPALPATVFLMQQDVVNHYRCAATHYLPLTLKEHYLQNSSLGTPHEKWAKFTDDDFAELSFTVTNLMRYTTRLIHETETVALRADSSHRGANWRSNAYITPLVEIEHRGKQIGIRIDPDESLAITAFSTKSGYAGKAGRRSDSNEWFHITTDANGKESTRIITKTEFHQLTQVLREEQVDIRNRDILREIRAKALAESDELTDLNRRFGTLCNLFYGECEVANPFDRLHESWWL